VSPKTFWLVYLSMMVCHHDVHPIFIVAHRKTLLSKDVHFEGICVHTHKLYDYVTVMVFSSEAPNTSVENHRITNIFEGNVKDARISGGEEIRTSQ
jgi:hypothetical protein